MPYTPPNAVANASPLTIRKYEKRLAKYMQTDGVIMSLIARRGWKTINVDHAEVAWGFETKSGSPVRGYGSVLPREFANCDNFPDWANGLLTFAWLVAPRRIPHDLRRWQYMGNPGQDPMTSLGDWMVREQARVMLSCGSSGVLFNLDGPTPAPNADGTYTYPVANYGGVAGQELGHLMERLQLEGAPLQAASALGVAAGNAEPVECTIVTSDPFNETITVSEAFDADTPGTAAAGWIVFYERRDSGGVQSLGDMPLGLFEGIDDWTSPTTLYTIDETEAPRYRSHVDTLASPAPLSESRLLDVLGLIECQAPVIGKDGDKIPRTFITMDPLQWRNLQKTLLQDRSVMVENGKVFKGAGGTLSHKMETFSGYPLGTDRLHARNSVFVGNGESTSILQNGPREGQFMTVDGRKKFAIPCSPDEEMRLISCYQLWFLTRAGQARLDSIEPNRVDAAP
ncbi:MAG TPA: hypothetical protein VMW94_01350 [Actinomycetes bacterium]|nr:hypothetical protein [Actinomycetes bacterium]